MFPDDDGADFHVPRRFRSRLPERGEGANERWDFLMQDAPDDMFSSALAMLGDRARALAGTVAALHAPLSTRRSGCRPDKSPRPPKMTDRQTVRRHFDENYSRSVAGKCVMQPLHMQPSKRACVHAVSLEIVQPGTL
jgi:hypothetical protein